MPPNISRRICIYHDKLVGDGEKREKIAPQESDDEKHEHTQTHNKNQMQLISQINNIDENTLDVQDVGKKRSLAAYV